MVRLLLIRHAATEASENNILLGSTDAEASGQGLAQLDRLTPLLAEYKPDSWYCSPMLRAVQTAEKLEGFGSIEQPFVIDKRLREVDLGRWEQKSFAEIKATDPDLIPAWSEYEDFVFPDGESVADFVVRVADVLESLRTLGAEEIGVIAHGGVIRKMICLGLGLSAKNYLLFNVFPASLTILDLYPEGGVLTGLNL